MDEFVNARCVGPARWCCGAVAVILACCAHAEVMRDPTRPPPQFESATLGEKQPIETGPRLQSVLISSSRRVAVISGQTVMVGDRFGTAQVVKILEDEVVLRNGNATQTLKLFAGIEKKPMRADALAAKAGGRDKIRDK